ncbi:MAG TPA: hypothetical protein VHD56_03800 [Tepidisphaeraceae bacterium]|nr:hypothetical protein [Tepidisphaeraceae bacterium]
MNDAAVIFEPENDVLGSIVSAYQREGFDAGYRRATRDLLATLVVNCHEFVREQPDSSPEMRLTLLKFVTRLQHKLDRDLRAAEYVEGGLGI